jgi:hypothetical protein
MRYPTIVVYAIIANHPSAGASDIIINMLGNAADQSAISGKCVSENNDTTLRCHTVQVSVSYALDQAGFDKEWKAGAAQFDVEFKTDSDVAKFCKSLGSDQEKVATAVKHPTDEQKANLAIAGASTLQGFLTFVEICKHPTRAALRQLTYNETLAETKQCRVQVALPGVDVFKKVSDQKWISTSGPEGACHTVTTSTLEQQSKNSSLWTWTQVTSTADDSKLCKTLGVTQSVNKPLVFTWRSSPFPMHCEAVGFGH